MIRLREEQKQAKAIRARSLLMDLIVSHVPPRARVLDLGCGNGELLLRLKDEKQVLGRGVDINDTAVDSCIARGISVFQGNLDEGLKDYANGAYDYVILSQTLQEVTQPLFVLEEMLRVGKKAIVSFPNFGFIQNRLQFLFQGRMPVNKRLPYSWHDTPNIHLCTCRDFRELCQSQKINIIKEIALRGKKHCFFPNLAAAFLLYVLEKPL